MPNEKDGKGKLFIYFVYPFIFTTTFYFFGDLYYTGNLKIALKDEVKVLLLSVWGFILFLSVFFLILLLIGLLGLIKRWL
ncbi:hypothetical protein [Sulfolobus spindle-shaped virus 6]|uniref:Uncharacterized protein n=1 Tax=Sulfolobus spindle-shaped virus 6 TaxID=693627 RepID=D1GF27_9VIRU|nr:hypothetical protein SSSV6_gp09 [Sulfolobus spindle-shaped virus 6]ACZ35729.1 hypothetical protein [Sulfolobus spindle-shaped virus 6]